MGNSRICSNCIGSTLVNATGWYWYVQVNPLPCSWENIYIMYIQDTLRYVTLPYVTLRYMHSKSLLLEGIYDVCWLLAH